MSAYTGIAKSGIDALWTGESAISVVTSSAAFLSATNGYGIFHLLPSGKMVKKIELYNVLDYLLNKNVANALSETRFTKGQTMPQFFNRLWAGFYSEFLDPVKLATTTGSLVLAVKKMGPVQYATSKGGSGGSKAFKALLDFLIYKAGAKIIVN